MKAVHAWDLRDRQGVLQQCGPCNTPSIDDVRRVVSWRTGHLESKLQTTSFLQKFAIFSIPRLVQM